MDEVYRRVSGHLRHLTITFHDGTTDRHETTDEHPYWVVGRGWTAAAELTVGDVLKTANDSTAMLTASFRAETPDGTAVYNFRVPGVHDYYVASPNAGTDATSGVLVHNANYPISAEGIQSGIRVPDRVQSRINISNAGWSHAVKEHFSSKASKCQFTIGQQELKSILARRDIAAIPVVRTL